MSKSGWIGVVFVLGCVVAACDAKRSSAPPASSQPPPSTSSPPTPSARPRGPVPCNADADCPHLACGPCTPGTPITYELLSGPECVVNPCNNPSATCNAQHICVVGAGTTKDPRVWGSASAPR
jgi:hypothetical protein